MFFPDNLNADSHREPRKAMEKSLAISVNLRWWISILPTVCGTEEFTV